MTAREEIVETLAAYFVAQVQKLNDQSYPYWSDVSSWDDHLKAHDTLVTTTFIGNPVTRVALVHLNVCNNGRVYRTEVRSVWESDSGWISAEHDPRAKDPQFREYLRLKAIYEGEE
jgi:hypothetical protein